MFQIVNYCAHEVLQSVGKMENYEQKQLLMFNDKGK